MQTFTFPERVPLAQTPTPLQFLSRVSAALGVNVWVKRDDLTGSVLSGNKVRKLEFCLAEAMQKGCDTLITCGGLQSNHCRATAIVGAQMGLKVRLLLRGLPKGVAEGNFFLDKLSGATVNCFSLEEYRRHLPHLLRQAELECQAEGLTPLVIPTGASDGLGLWGYLQAVEELAEDFAKVGIQPSHIVSATGSGGTQAGLTLGSQLKGWSSKVVGFAVCDNESYFQKKVRADMRDWQQRYTALFPWVANVDTDEPVIRVNDQYVGPGYAKADKEVFETIQWLARTEGIVLDPVYTGKAFHGMLNVIQRGLWPEAKDVVFVHTGGIFGTFAQREQFDFI